jgi:hypothetical protein
MHAAIRDEDGRLLQLSAHRLKSLVSSYNHARAHELAQQLENAGKNLDFKPAADLLDRLRPLMGEFESALRHHLQQQT